MNVEHPGKPFSLLVKPASADCNLRCTYCFYLDRRELYPDTRVHRMSDEVLEAMIRSFMATPQPQYAIGWQGGEPTLMGLDFFKRVTALQQKYGRAGSVVANGLQTNSILINDEFAEHLARYNFLVGVSLDGPAEVHNQYRRFADGRATHDRVIRAIRTLERHRVEYNVLTLVSQSNVRNPAEIYRYLCDQGVYYHQYIECVEFDREGRLQPFAITAQQWGDFLCAVFDEWIKRDMRRISVRLFDSILTMMVDGMPNVCQMGADCRQYFVVEHNGDVYPCDFFVRRELKLGNVLTGSWHEFQTSELYRQFGERKRQWHPNCAACEFVRFCAGDCPKNRPMKGRDPAQLSVLCDGWRQFYAHTLPRFERIADQIRRERMGGMGVPPPGATPSNARPSRNAPCPCGSGKKFKHCCGAGL
ncbi:MAG: anaerobic sulfatase maturase [Kiritimatiellae bacterium]|nr:anaerobic sulfatase maturase [Kiritimatiellia bacterium]